MKISREWATPLTIGAFLIMSATGLLLFFRWDIGLNKFVHEWVGWAMVLGVLAHSAANWPSFKRYFSTALGKGLIGAGAMVLMASFFLRDNEQSPRSLATHAVANASLSVLAPLTGRSLEQVINDLVRAGVKIEGPNVSIKSAAAGDRDLEGKAIRVLFGQNNGGQNNGDPSRIEPQRNLKPSSTQGANSG